MNLQLPNGSLGIQIRNGYTSKPYNDISIVAHNSYNHLIVAKLATAHSNHTSSRKSYSHCYALL